MDSIGVEHLSGVLSTTASTFHDQKRRNQVFRDPIFSIRLSHKINFSYNRKRKRKRKQAIHILSILRNVSLTWANTQQQIPASIHHSSSTAILMLRKGSSPNQIWNPITRHWILFRPYLHRQKLHPNNINAFHMSLRHRPKYLLM